MRESTGKPKASGGKVFGRSGAAELMDMKPTTVASRIKSGQVYINTYGAGGGVELPFGGYKKSGYGREKGLESLASYTQVKNVCVKFA